MTVRRPPRITGNIGVVAIKAAAVSIAADQAGMAAILVAGAIDEGVQSPLPTYVRRDLQPTAAAGRGEFLAGRTHEGPTASSGRRGLAALGYTSPRIAD